MFETSCFRVDDLEVALCVNCGDLVALNVPAEEDISTHIDRHVELVRFHIEDVQHAIKSDDSP